MDQPCTWDSISLNMLKSPVCVENQKLWEAVGERNKLPNLFCRAPDFWGSLEGLEMGFWEGRFQSHLILPEPTNHGNTIWKRQAKVPKPLGRTRTSCRSGLEGWEFQRIPEEQGPAWAAPPWSLQLHPQEWVNSWNLPHSGVDFLISPRFIPILCSPWHSPLPPAPSPILPFHSIPTTSKIQNVSIEHKAERLHLLLSLSYKTTGVQVSFVSANPKGFHLEKTGLFFLPKSLALLWPKPALSALKIWSGLHINLRSALLSFQGRGSEEIKGFCCLEWEGGWEKRTI